jgi:ABC-type branched-subunit amino acid transport system substrate-binding protein
MTTPTSTRRPAAGTLAVALALALVVALATGACSSSKTAASGGSTTTAPAAGAKPLKTDVGVTTTDITLGIITDETGVFAALGKTVVQGTQLFWDQQNAAGGVCGRQVKLVIRDMGYDVQKARNAYTEIKDQVLGFNELLGSPMNAALKPSVKADRILTSPVSWASSLLDNPYTVMAGTTYDLEMINGVDYLFSQGKIKAGDSVGHIYIEGDYGANGLAGDKLMAQKRGYTIVEEKIKATDTDMTAQVTDLKSKGVKVVFLTDTPTQTASVANVAKGSGYEVTMFGNNPAFAPAVLAGPAKDYLEKHFYLASSYAPFASTDAGPSKLAADYTKAHPSETPNNGVDFGYGQADIYRQILAKACGNGDMTRDGMLTAFQSLTNVDTHGVIGPLDYSKPGQPPSKQAYIAQASATDKGGLKQVKTLFAAPEAQSFVLSGGGA